LTYHIYLYIEWDCTTLGDFVFVFKEETKRRSAKCSSSMNITFLSLHHRSAAAAHHKIIRVSCIYPSALFVMLSTTSLIVVGDY
jgi:hypothetical protein